MSGRHSRSVLFPGIGSAGQERIGRLRVAFVGVGAVGAAAAELAVRAGIMKATLVDRDVVEPSNLSRQLLFDASDAAEVRPKATAAAARLAAIDPSVLLVPVVADLEPGNVRAILAEHDLARRARREHQQDPARVGVVERDLLIRAQDGDPVLVERRGAERCLAGGDRRQTDVQPSQGRSCDGSGRVGRELVQRDAVAASDQSGQPASRQRAVDVPGAHDARDAPLLPPRKRRCVEVVVAFGVAAEVDDPRHPGSGDGDIDDSAARAGRVGAARALAADRRGALRLHVPDEDLRAARSAAADRVGEPRSVHRDRLDPSVRVLDVGDRRRGGCRRNGESEEQDCDREDTHAVMVAAPPEKILKFR